jgi:phytoene synthase
MLDTPPLSHTAEQVRRYDRDRFVTGLFAPASRREDLFALYAFNLELAKVREVVREPVMGQIRLQWWRDVVSAISAGAESPAHPVAGPLAEAMRRHRLDDGVLQRLIDSREADLGDEPPPNLAALEAYAEASSATLTDLALAVLGADREATRRAGRHVGIAWALVGLLRAVPFHARLGRLTLPADRLATHGVTRDQVLSGQAVPGLNRVAAEVAELARDHLRRARSERRSVEPAALPVLLPARLADAHLAALSRSGHTLFAPGWPTSGRHPVRLAVSALLRRW